MAAGASGSVAAGLVRPGDAWEVSEYSGRAGQSDPLGRKLDENSGASWCKTTGLMDWKMIGASSWAS